MDALQTSPVRWVESIFDHAYFGIIVKELFPQARRIVEDWRRARVEISISLGDWHAVESERFSAWRLGFTGHQDGLPMTSHRVMTSDGPMDGFPVGVRFVVISVERAALPSARPRLV